MKNYTQKIDFVVLWVDPNDKEWQKNREKQIIDSEGCDNREQRYRDWGLFRYWFRCVEKYAPWVNRIHLVTCGHIPEWLNTNHPKLNIVKHSDFMPKEALPTFNSNAIELCVHNIPGLSEQFVLFNDDVFLTKKVKPTDFFRNGKPVNTMTLFALMPTSKDCFYKTVAKNISIINKHFNYNEFKRKNVFKILSLRQREWLLFSVPMLAYNNFMGFRNYHIANSYLKKTYKNIWACEKELLSQTVMCKIRNYDTNVSHWLCNYWQFASGHFCQRNSHFGISIAIDRDDAVNVLCKQKYHVVCLNDNNDIDNYKDISKHLKCGFEKIVPGKSEYER